MDLQKGDNIKKEEEGEQCKTRQKQKPCRIRQRKRAQVFHVRQLADNDPLAPALPPDMVEGIPEDGNLLTSRERYQGAFSISPSNKKNCRRYVCGNLYKRFDHFKDDAVEFFDLEELGNFNLEIWVAGKGGEDRVLSIIKVRQAGHTLCEKIRKLATKIDENPPVVNARAKVKGDLGKMWTFGCNSSEGDKLFVPTKWLFDMGTNSAEVCEGICEFMKETGENGFSPELREIQKIEKEQKRLIPSALGGKCGVSCAMVVSQDLTNASHYDLDGSLSFTVWSELKPGRAQNWFFVLPNVLTKEGKVVVIQIRDGLAVSWDGRIIRHCSSWVDCGEENSVFGFFFSTKDKKEKKKNQPKIENLCYHQTSSEPFFIQKENPK